MFSQKSLPANLLSCLKFKLVQLGGCLAVVVAPRFERNVPGAASLNVHLHYEVREEQERKRFSLL